jgi:hypothetical protein
MATHPSFAKTLFNKSVKSLNNGESISTDELDMAIFDKYVISFIGDASGLTLDTRSRATLDDNFLSTPIMYNSGLLFLASFIVRQRYMAFILTNNTGQTVTNVNLTINATLGSSDKTSCFPLALNPTVSSLASLTQSVMIGKDSDGNFVNIGANQDGALSIFDSNLRRGRWRIQPVVNPLFGAALNQNAAFGGTPENVHDGTDNIYWTGSNISGNRITFDSTGQAKTGTKSVYANDPRVGNIWQFAKGSNLDLSNYTVLSFSIYVEQAWAESNTIILYGYDTVAGQSVGTSVEIKNYIGENQVGFWQDVVVSLADLSLEGQTIDAIRFECIERSGAGAQFYTDDIAFQQSGGAISFKLFPNTGKKYSISKLLFNVASTGTRTSNPPAFAYDRWGNLPSLSVGLLLGCQSEGVQLFQFSVRQVADLCNGGAEILNIIDDGNNTHYSVHIPLTQEEYFVLDSSQNDFFEVIVNDNLSSLQLCNCFVTGFEEDIG